MIKSIRPTTKRLELLVDILNSDHIFKGEAKIARNNSIAVLKNDEELFVFCIDEMLDEHVVDLCNIIITFEECVKDKFSFSSHAPDPINSIFFHENGFNDSRSLCLNVRYFENRLDFNYQRYFDERISIDRSVHFTDLEQFSIEIRKFLDEIEELDLIE